jgi:hypothetical protein
MVQAEATLLHKAAELCWRMDQTFLQAQDSQIPEPQKSAVVHMAGNAAMDAGECLNALIKRYLMKLSHEGPSDEG